MNWQHPTNSPPPHLGTPHHPKQADIGHLPHLSFPKNLQSSSKPCPCHSCFGAPRTVGPEPHLRPQTFGERSMYVRTHVQKCGSVACHALDTCEHELLNFNVSFFGKKKRQNILRYGVLGRAFVTTRGGCSFIYFPAGRSLAHHGCHAFFCSAAPSHHHHASKNPVTFPGFVCDAKDRANAPSHLVIFPPVFTAASVRHHHSKHTHYLLAVAFLAECSRLSENVSYITPRFPETTTRGSPP